MKSPSILPISQDDISKKKSQSDELNQINETLNAIRTQIGRHIDSQRDAAATIKQPGPQWFPQTEDWDQRSFEKWLRSLIPIQSKLERIRLKFFASLSNSTTNLRVSIGAHPDEFPIRMLAPSRKNAAPMIKQFSHINCPEEDLYWVFDEGEKSKFIQICRMEYDDEGCPMFVSESCMQESLLENIPKGSLVLWEPSPVRKKNKKRHSTDKPWTGLGCGTVIDMNLQDTTILPMPLIAFILWRLRHAEDTGYPSHREKTFALEYILSFTSRWNALPQPIGSFSQNISIYFNIRWMDISKLPRAYNNTDLGLQIKRESGDIPHINRKVPSDLHLLEVKHSLCLVSTIQPLPFYSLLLLQDREPCAIGPLRQYVAVELAERAERVFKGRGGNLGRLTAVGFFLAFLGVLLETVVGNWDESLDRLDETLVTSLSELKRSRRQDLMFDNDQFAKSDQYFTALQVLRICSDWIKQVNQGLKTLHGQIDISKASLDDDSDDDSNTHTAQDKANERKQLDEMFSIVMAENEARSRPRLDRIERKVEEVKSLRDGLFNATSVREASKGTSLAEMSGRQNQYILVFTIATVFYLPMSFVTSFYGMHLFDQGDDPSASKAPFIATFVVLSLATYILAASGLWFVKGRAEHKSTRRDSPCLDGKTKEQPTLFSLPSKKRSDSVV
ncbi:hypothetical protein PENANT_c002G07007 [Penicillium antarcticum]|uniref:Uncharacterized protein n=1 Tax=Penicillium antarcticum TaxID=416450 RepID=A0A1V6QKN9_9EURO|nr:hypothetical protein PENANT_c002G07007 [Penicillium antarcticum]